MSGAVTVGIKKTWNGEGFNNTNRHVESEKHVWWVAWLFTPFSFCNGGWDEQKWSKLKNWERIPQSLSWVLAAFGLLLTTQNGAKGLRSLQKWSGSGYPTSTYKLLKSQRVARKFFALRSRLRVPETLLNFLDPLRIHSDHWHGNKKSVHLMMPSKFLHPRWKNLVGIQRVMNRNMIVEIKQVPVQPAEQERIAFIERTIEKWY